MTANIDLTAEAEDIAKDQPLIEDIRLLGRLLGETVKAQQGDGVFELIETIRRMSVQFHREDDLSARQALEDILRALDPALAVQVIRAFSYFSHLANIAEDHHHVRRTRHHAIGCHSSARRPCQACASLRITETSVSCIATDGPCCARGNNGWQQSSARGMMYTSAFTSWRRDTHTHFSHARGSEGLTHGNLLPRPQCPIGLRSHRAPDELVFPGCRHTDRTGQDYGVSCYGVRKWQQWRCVPSAWLLTAARSC